MKLQIHWRQLVGISGRDDSLHNALNRRHFSSLGNVFVFWFAPGSSAIRKLHSSICNFRVARYQGGIGKC
jgi:hypothetical protein